MQNESKRELWKGMFCCNAKGCPMKKSVCVSGEDGYVEK